jgi:hypothetical protein
LPESRHRSFIDCDDIEFWYRRFVGEHQRTLAAIIAQKANIAWPDIEAMLHFLGAEFLRGRGRGSGSF